MIFYGGDWSPIQIFLHFYIRHILMNHHYDFYGDDWSPHSNIPSFLHSISFVETTYGVMLGDVRTLAWKPEEHFELISVTSLG